MTTVEHPVVSPKKLIEVALPLDAINAASQHEKAVPRRGHPATFHLWWARRPLAAARAVIFSQLVNDPEDLWWHQNPGAVPTKQTRGHWTKARQRLFKIIEELVLWENTTNEDVLARARGEIRKSWRDVCDLNKNHPQAIELFDPDQMPGLHDPFAGGGTIPLETLRLGLNSHASDLNPVAVLINKALTAIPPRFSNRPPVCPESPNNAQLIPDDWPAAKGMAEDVRRYGEQMRNTALAQIGQLYPQVEVTKAMASDRPDLKALVGKKLTVICWLWARTVPSPNPAMGGAAVPLVTTYLLSSKKGREAYIEPRCRAGKYNFTVRIGKIPDELKGGTAAGRQKGFRCILSDSPISYEYIRNEAIAGRMGERMTAIVAEGPRGRVYLPPQALHEEIAARAKPAWQPTLRIPDQALGFRVQLYGIPTFAGLFTARQLAALSTLSEAIQQIRERICADAIRAGLPDDGVSLNDGGRGAAAYADAVSVYLAFALSKQADWCNSFSSYIPAIEGLGHLFSRQAIPMVWDFIETNVFSESAGNILNHLEWVSAMLAVAPATHPASVMQADAAAIKLASRVFVSTDPPYYDNIGYSDLSDFFYVWLRHTLRSVFPDLLSTIAVPKAEELVATPFRHGNKAKAEEFFLSGMTRAMNGIAAKAHPAAPVTIYYAFKQSETGDTGTNSAGWETFLAAVLDSGLTITGTWPMRTERSARSVGQGTNALASSIVLVCRPRERQAGTISRRQFVRLLNETLPAALAKMTGADEDEHSPVAPVDLSQAIIGPGMAIFSRYDAVLEADGTPMTVKTALQLINRFLAEDDFDGDTQFCLHWFEQHGWEKAKFGEADTLARAKGTSVDGVKAAGVIESGGGNVRLLKWKEYPADWNPTLDTRLPVWEALHQLIRAYSSKGDAGAGKVLKACSGKAEAARQLAYRLYTLCERKGWAEDARAYNEVVTGWPGIEKAAGTGGEEQRELFNG
jgi:putative DNA methylase